MLFVKTLFFNFQNGGLNFRFLLLRFPKLLRQRKLLNDIFYNIWFFNSILFRFLVVRTSVHRFFRAHHLLAPHFLIFFNQERDSLVVRAIFR